MWVLGLQGSPRKKGNTSFLLSTFMNEAERLGARTHVVDVDKKNIIPCKEYIVCEKKGFCPIDDDMTHEIYPLLRQADVIVAATPVFFYSTTAQLKALIDRSQTLWARKYKLQLTDPGRNTRRGFLLAVGATKGKNLFEGLQLTVKYFFDAVGAGYAGSLTYRNVENKGDMEKHPTVIEDVKQAVGDLLKPFLNRKVILFAGRENNCRSQMACAFAQHLAGDNIEPIGAGYTPAKETDPSMVAVMKEKGIDMAFRIPQPLDLTVLKKQPDLVIFMDRETENAAFPESKRQVWDLPDPSGKALDYFRNVRDDIEEKVKEMIARI